jgi:tetratricopeptide (TPR) repeat protein
MVWVMLDRLFLRKLSLVLIGLLSLVCFKMPLVYAQDIAIINPLENQDLDPLLPNPDRPLSEVEISNLNDAVKELQQQGETLYQQGQIDAAFKTWYRELRLKRKLGRFIEVETLARVGGIAWQDNRKEDLKNIENRLINIETESLPELAQNLELLNILGEAYRELRSLDRTIIIYQKILVYAREKQDVNSERIALETIGKLYLAKFDYPNAIETYEQLLVIAKSQNNSVSEEIYLRQLVDSYSQINQLEKSLIIKQQLLEKYRDRQQNELIAKLQIAIADNYLSLNTPTEADRAYQEAFNLAWSLQQYSVATEALSKLGSLYLAYNEQESALQVYEELLKVEEQTKDYYGSTNTYDRIGQIYLKSKNYALALIAFERGLNIAKSLKYREDYFTQQIEITKQEMNL